MITYTLNGKEVLLVDVPKNQSYFDLYGSTEKLYLKYTTMLSPGKFKRIEISLPVGLWSLLGKGDKISEHDASQIVEGNYFDGIGTQYANYSLGRVWELGERFDKATDSLQSLIRAQGKEPNLIVVLVK